MLIAMSIASLHDIRKNPPYIQKVCNEKETARIPAPYVGADLRAAFSILSVIR